MHQPTILFVDDHKLPTFLPATKDLLFLPLILLPHPETLEVQMKTITPILTILGAPDLVSFKLSVSSETVFISTHI